MGVDLAFKMGYSSSHGSRMDRRPKSKGPTMASLAPLTNSPIRPADVHFSTREYLSAHGKAPRGRGQWAFCPANRYDSSNYLDFVKWFGSSYAEAKRDAAKAFAAAGVMEVVVCS